MARTDGTRVDDEGLSARLDRLDIDCDSMAVMLNIFRVGMAFRNHTEQTILDRYGLSFSGFTVLWVLWVWDKKQFFELAEECGVSKGTLTGVINTLEKSGYIERKPHASDRRRLVVQLSRRGRNLQEGAHLLRKDERDRIGHVLCSRSQASERMNCFLSRESGERRSGKYRADQPETAKVVVESR